VKVEETLFEVIDRLNRLFGDVTPLKDQATFVNHIVAIARENDVVMAQVENNSREQAPQRQSARCSSARGSCGR
jgi:hypothetical protein